MIYGEGKKYKIKQFTFIQKHSLGFIQYRFDYILISNTLQEFVTMTEILTPISTDNSPVLFSLSKKKTTIRGKGFWKFNNFLTKNHDSYFKRSFSGTLFSFKRKKYN